MSYRSEGRNDALLCLEGDRGGLLTDMTLSKLYFRRFCSGKKKYSLGLKIQDHLLKIESQ